VLPHIDQVIDSTDGCILLSLLNYYSSYHQIALVTPKFKFRKLK
jgi:hypothetical protein